VVVDPRKFLAVTFNPARDATYVLERFVRGSVNRVVRQQVMAGGKGNNVARVLVAYGHSVRVTGFLAGNAGFFIDDGLRAAGIETAFSWLESGESRTCHTLIESESGVISEVLESGPTVGAREGEAFLADLPARLVGIDTVVVSGSLPPGLEGPFLTDFMAIARQHCTRLMIDSSGEGLRIALAGGPDLIKPNERELATLMGGTPSTTEMVRYAQEDMIGSVMPSDGRVLLSLAERGAMLIGRSEVWYAASPPITPNEIVNTVGCGDALLAGFLDGCARNLPASDALAQAVAFGAAAALSEVAGVVERAEVDRLHAAVSATPWRA
jgi:tagatose 6-phosphate kinase